MANSKYLPWAFFMLAWFIGGDAAAAQMTVGDLNVGDKNGCRFYILGVFEGVQIASGTVQDSLGRFQEARDKRFCVPEGLTSAAMELEVKIKMGSDLAVFPQDRDMPAVSFVTAVIAQQFPCQPQHRP